MCALFVPSDEPSKIVVEVVMWSIGLFLRLVLGVVPDEPSGGTRALQTLTAL